MHVIVLFEAMSQKGCRATAAGSITTQAIRRITLSGSCWRSKIR